MLAAAAKLGLLAGFLAVLTAVFAVRTAFGDHALAGWVRAFVRVGHDVTSPPLYASDTADHKIDRRVAVTLPFSDLSYLADSTFVIVTVMPLTSPVIVSDSPARRISPGNF